MNRKGFTSGFTLIELLVVIAIIAILAAILFPVFNQVRERTKQTQCMTQMHDIGSALKLFKEDNNKYPTVLFGFAEVTGGGAPYTGGTAVASNISSLNYKPLFTKQNYLRDNIKFLCPDTLDKTAGPPTNLTTPKLTTSAVYPVGSPLAGSNYVYSPAIKHNMGADQDPNYNFIPPPTLPKILNSTNVYFYKYDNYDVQPKPNATLDGPDPSGAYELHYTLNWSLPQVYNTDPISTPADYAAYPNQLKYGNLADDSHTIITFCSEHVTNANSDKVLVLTLGLSTKAVDKKLFYSKGPLGILK